MGKTTFSGPIRTGKNTGVSATSTLGHVTMNQKQTLTRSNSAQTHIGTLPDGSDITDIRVYVTEAFATANASGGNDVVDIKVGVSGIDAHYGTISGVSGVGIYTLEDVSAAVSNWQDVSANTAKLMAIVTAQGSVVSTGGSGIIFTTYRQN